MMGTAELQVLGTHRETIMIPECCTAGRDRRRSAPTIATLAFALPVEGKIDPRAVSEQYATLRTLACSTGSHKSFNQR
uniref:Lipase class 3 family protein n=1 Tax=Rhizophora mucronata TaxID=61149 RepID=A0A2P2INY1_RHIMU